MDFEATEGQRLIRDAARDFARDRIAPAAARYDEAETFPSDAVCGLASLGFMGVCLPEEVGGSGLDFVSLAVAIEEIARASAGLALIVSVSNTLVAQTILDHGSAEHRGGVLGRLARGESIGAFALAEPSAGSDLLALATTARPDGQGWVLEGAKWFVTNGPAADVFLVFGQTDPGRGESSLSCFLVGRDAPGVSIGPIEKKLGLRSAPSCALGLSGCRVGPDALVGARGEGYGIATRALGRARIGVAAQAVGIAQASLDAGVRYARQRRQFGRPIGQFQAIQWKLADMKTEVDAARLLTYRAASLLDRGADASMAGAQAKLFATRTAVRAAIETVQIHGGSGYMKDYPVERYMRDAKVTEVDAGTSEIQRIFIATRLLDGDAST